MLLDIVHSSLHIANSSRNSVNISGFSSQVGANLLKFLVNMLSILHIFRIRMRNFKFDLCFFESLWGRNWIFRFDWSVSLAFPERDITANHKFVPFWIVEPKLVTILNPHSPQDSPSTLVVPSYLLCLAESAPQVEYLYRHDNTMSSDEPMMSNRFVRSDLLAIVASVTFLFRPLQPIRYVCRCFNSFRPENFGCIRVENHHSCCLLKIKSALFPYHFIHACKELILDSFRLSPWPI